MIGRRPADSTGFFWAQRLDNYMPFPSTPFPGRPLSTECKTLFIFSLFFIKNTFTIKINKGAKNYVFRNFYTIRSYNSIH